MNRCTDGSHRHHIEKHPTLADMLMCTDCGQTKSAPPAHESRLRLQSKTDPRLTYTIHVRHAPGEPITATCNCRGYNSHGHCKHATAAVNVYTEEREQAEARKEPVDV